MLTTPRYLCCTTQHERHEEHKGTGVNVCDSWTRNHELHTRLRHPLHKISSTANQRRKILFGIYFAEALKF